MVIVKTLIAELNRAGGQGLSNAGPERVRSQPDRQTGPGRG